MSDALIMPLAMATIFTTGGILIQRLERHAERVKGILGIALVLFSFLDLLAVFSRLAEKDQHLISQTAIPQEQARHMSLQTKRGDELTGSD